eukprot:1316045-Prymnesium_polylepis.2
MLKNVAKNVVTSPSCNMNRWADNHYALDIFDGSFDYIIDYVDAHSSVLYQCADFGVTGLHYIYDPTGCVLTLPRRFILSAQAAPWLLDTAPCTLSVSVCEPNVQRWYVLITVEGCTSSCCRSKLILSLEALRGSHESARQPTVNRCF